MKMSNKVYDILKWVALTALPAASALVYALSTIWGFPHVEHIIGTIAAAETFLGVILGISNAQYNKSNSVDTGENKTDNNANNE